MKSIRFGWAPALVCVMAPPAFAQLTPQHFNDFVGGLAASSSLGATDSAPIVQNGVTKKWLPFNYFLSRDGSNVTIPAAPTNLLGNATFYNYPAMGYGPCATGDTSNMGACVNAAAAAAALGGTVVVPQGSFNFATTIAPPEKVKIVGAGGANYGRCGTALTWNGSLAGVMFQAGSDSSAQPSVGGGLSRICLNGNGIAADGLKLRSAVWGDYEDVYVQKVTGKALNIDVSSTANLPSGFNHFKRFYADLSHASAITATGVYLGPGTSTQNNNRNVFDDLVINYQQGIGIDCWNADSNEFRNAHVEPTGSSPGYSAVLHGSASSVLETCRSTRLSGEFGVSLVAGTGIHALSDTYPSKTNWLFLNQESGAPLPTVDGSATLYSITSTGAINGGVSISSTAPYATGNFSSANLGIGSTSWVIFGQDADGLVQAGSANTDANLRLSPKGAGLSVLTQPGYGSGCTLSNDGSLPNTVIGIAVCTTADQTTGRMMVPNGAPLAAYTKSTAAWAVGTGNGCLDTGAVGNNTFYYVYQIQRSGTRVVDYLCTATFGSPTMPTNYDRKRYIGAVKTDGSAHILAFTQVGNEFVWNAPVTDVSVVTLGTGSQTSLTLANVPNGYAVQAHLRGAATRAAGAAAVAFTSLSEVDAAAGGGNTNAYINAAGYISPVDLRIMTNTAQAIAGRANQANTTASLETVGWVDPKLEWPH